MLRSALQNSTAAQPVCWVSKISTRHQLHRCTTPLTQNHTLLSKCRSARRLQHLVPDADAVAADALPDLLLDLGVAEDVAGSANPEIFESRPSRLPAVYSSSGHTNPAAADGSTDWTASDDVDISAASKRLTAAAVNKKQQPQNPVPQPAVSLLLESATQQAGQLQGLAGSSEAPHASSSSSSDGGSSTAVRAVPWRSADAAAAAAAAAADVGIPTHSAAHAEATHSSQHAAGAEPPPALAAAAAAAAMANNDAGATAAGSFFSSRASMLQQLRQQQVQVQRTHVMKQHSQQLYRYTVADGDDSSRIKRQPPSTPISPVKQTTFTLAKQQPQTHTTASINSSSSSSQGSVGLQQLAAGGLQDAATEDDQEEPWLDNQQQMQQQQQQQQELLLQQEQGDGSSPPLPSYLQPQQQQHHAAATETQHQDLTHTITPSRQTVSSSGITAIPLTSTRPSPQDPSRGLCLSAFLYCCSRTQLLSLTWQLGLPPSALRIVSRVADADLVLHVKPGPGVRHYDYETYRSQAAAKGIPFIDLKSLSLLELQLYLLPVFRLYAGELSPRDLLLRKKRRGYKTRYTNIKLPPA